MDVKKHSFHFPSRNIQIHNKYLRMFTSYFLFQNAFHINLQLTLSEPGIYNVRVFIFITEVNVMI